MDTDARTQLARALEATLGSQEAQTLMSYLDGRDDLVTREDLRLTGSDLNGRMDQLDGRMDQLDGRMDQLDGRMDQLDGRMDQLAVAMRALDDRVDTRLDAMREVLDARLGGMDHRIHQVLDRFDRAEERVLFVARGEIIEAFQDQTRTLAITMVLTMVAFAGALVGIVQLA